MQQVIREYGSAMLAAFAVFLFLGVLGGMLLSKGGLLAQMILFWGNGGC